MLLSSWRGVCCVARVCITVVGLVRSSFISVPSGQQFIVAIYACTLTCGRGFTVCGVRGVLIS